MSINYYLPKFNGAKISVDFLEVLLEKHGSMENLEKSIPLIYNREDDIQIFEHYLDDDLREILEKSKVGVIIMSPKVLAEFGDYHPESLVTIDGFCTRMDGEDVIMVSIDILESQPEYILNLIMRHELIHYNQMKSGRLDINNEEMALFWDGENQFERLIEANNISPLEAGDPVAIRNKQVSLPWELEAYGESFDVYMDEMISGVFEIQDSENMDQVHDIHNRWLDLVIAGKTTPAVIY